MEEGAGVVTLLSCVYIISTFTIDIKYRNLILIKPQLNFMFYFVCKHTIVCKITHRCWSVVVIKYAHRNNCFLVFHSLTLLLFYYPCMHRYHVMWCDVIVYTIYIYSSMTTKTRKWKTLSFSRISWIHHFNHLQKKDKLIEKFNFIWIIFLQKICVATSRKFGDRWILL